MRSTTLPYYVSVISLIALIFLGLAWELALAPVRPGDALTMHAEVLDARCSERNPALGILRWQWRIVNQAGVAVLDLVATSLFDLAPRPAARSPQMAADTR